MMRGILHLEDWGWANAPRKGSNTSTSTTSNAPPAQYTQAYSDVLSKAQNVISSNPYQSYPGSPYSMIAGFSPDQLSAMGITEASQGIGFPYINTAAQYISNATQPLQTPAFQSYLGQAAGPQVTNAAQSGLGAITQAGQTGQGMIGATAYPAVGNIYGASTSYTPGQIPQWMSPYTQNVVDTTQAQFNNQNLQQQNQLRGNAASQGALGGDRLGVAQGILSNQQQLAQAPVIANLYQQGYLSAEQAAQAAAQLRTQGAVSGGQLGVGAAQAGAQLGLGAAEAGYGMGLQGATAQAQLESGAAQQVLGANEAQAWLNSQAGYGMANLGSEAYTQAFGGANQLYSMGTAQQQLGQEYLNIPYEQWVAQQAYPYQQTSWLANIAEGLGSQAGGTATGTTSQSGTGSVGSSVAGLGMTAAGIYGIGNQAGWWNNNSNSNNNTGGSTGTVGYASEGAQPSGYTTGYVSPNSARGGRIPERATGGSAFTSMPWSDAPSPISTDSSNIPNPADAGIVPQGASSAAAGKTMNILQDYGTTSTTTGGSSTGSQVESGVKTAAGIGAAAAGIAGASGSTVGALALLAAIKRGGRVPPRRASGGSGSSGATSASPNPNIGTPTITMMQPSWQGAVAIPQISMTGGSGTGTSGTSISGTSTGSNQSFSSYLNSVLGQIPTSAQLAATTPTTTATTTPVVDTSGATTATFQNTGGAQDVGGIEGGSGTGPDPGSSADVGSFERGGGIGHFGIGHFADGGSPDVATILVPSDSGGDPFGFGAAAQSGLDTPPANTNAPPPANTNVPPRPTMPSRSSVIPRSTATDTRPSPQTDPRIHPSDTNAFESAMTDLNRIAQPSQFQQAMAGPWGALLQAGLGTLAGRSRYPLENIGAGALAGMKAWESGRKDVEDLSSRVAEAKARIAETQANHEQMMNWRFGNQDIQANRYQDQKDIAMIRALNRAGGHGSDRETIVPGMLSENNTIMIIDRQGNLKDTGVKASPTANTQANIDYRTQHDLQVQTQADARARSIETRADTAEFGRNLREILREAAQNSTPLSDVDARSRAEALSAPRGSNKPQVDPNNPLNLRVGP